MNQQLQPKHWFALLSVMFFPFLAQYLIKDPSYQLTEEDKYFIKSYILPGYIVIWLIIIFVILKIFAYFIASSFWSSFFSLLGNTVFFADMFFLLYLIYSILQDKSFALKVDFSSKNSEGTVLKIDIIKLIPGFNVFYWYKNNFDPKDAYFIKESLLLLFLIVLTALFSSYISLFLFTFYIIRIVTLLFGIDIVPDKFKGYVLKVFIKNPEEIFAIIPALGEYIYISSKTKVDFSSIWEKYKKYYSQAVEISQIKKNKFLMIEYIIFLLILILISFCFYDLVSYNSFYWYLIILFLWARYLIMFYTGNAIYIPIINEIISAIFYLFEKKKKNVSSDQNKSSTENIDTNNS